MLHQTIQLWEQGQYRSEDSSGFQPTLVTYLLGGKKKRATVLICPGGGYEFTSEREAEPIAIQFNAAGLHACVLYYSVSPNRHPQPLLDVSRAMNIIRNHAEDWQVEAQHIAVCGFSAGGHLAASLGVHWDKSYLNTIPGLQAGLNQPNALILCYPVISSGASAHQGSFLNLLGTHADPAQLHEMSLEHQITSKTPPTFLWHTYEDMPVPVENSLLFAKGLNDHKVPFELHIYPRGPHGLALATKETDEGGGGDVPHVASWLTLCTEWLEQTFA